MSELDITGGDEKKVGYYAGSFDLPLLVSTLTRVYFRNDRKLSFSPSI